MTKSKKLVRAHLQPVLSSGYSRKDFARDMEFESPNYVSMLLRENYPNALLSPNRIESFAGVCGLSDEDVLRLALARLEDAGDKPVEMNAAALKFLLRSYGRLIQSKFVLTRRAA